MPLRCISDAFRENCLFVYNVACVYLHFEINLESLQETNGLVSVLTAALYLFNFSFTSLLFINIFVHFWKLGKHYLIISAKFDIGKVSSTQIKTYIA